LKTIKLRDTRGNETTATVIKDKKEINRNRVKKWRKDNPDKYKEHQEYTKQWKNNNKDKVTQYAKTWYDKHRDEYYQKNKDRLNANLRRYRRKKKLLEEKENGIKSVNSRRKTAPK
jgi:hypothetical protein